MLKVQGKFSFHRFAADDSLNRNAPPPESTWVTQVLELFFSLQATALIRTSGPITSSIE